MTERDLDRPKNSGLKQQKKSKSGGGSKKDPTRLFLIITAAIFVGVLVHAVWKNSRSEKTVELELSTLSSERAELPKALSNKGLPLEELHGQLKGANLQYPRAYVALYQSGRWKGDAWGVADGLKGAIKKAYDSAVKASGQGEATDAMLVIPTDRHRLRSQNFKGLLSNVHRGTRGVLITKPPSKEEKKTARELDFAISPTRTVATNRSLVDELEKAAKDRDIKLKAWLKESEAYAFDARQFFVPLAEGKKVQETVRGNRVIPIEEVTQASTRDFTRMLTEWMFNNLHPGGRMTYMYFPSRGREPRNSNNMIRQWMGTVAMGRAAALNPDLGYGPRVEENIHYNLKKFYKSEGDIGFIEYRNMAKLGAGALAMISLIESPARESFQAEEAGLMKLTLNQWRSTGEFITFYKPEGKNVNHNFYPGETLLAWSFLYEKNPDPALLAKIMDSYRYYKTWHLENRNPAFIPWHTQAYYNVWKLTKDEGLKDWVFEMNDWLVDVMQTDSRVAYDDTIGRFYAPTRRFGRPHASSTGVYLEGLIDAFGMARTIGDKEHQEKYRKAIVYGLRSSMQLQFQDEVDMFYASNRKRLRGGIRTTVYDNAIRVDNVQHVLMGVQKILRDFEADDFHP